MARLHFHVVSFLPGCLNDYDSGRMTKRAALLQNADSVRDYRDNGWTATGTRERYQTYTPSGHIGPVLKVEECVEECNHDDFYI